MPTLGLPHDPALPLFVYGLLKPRELAHSLVEPFVRRQAQASVAGTLWLRDGIPLFDPGTNGRVGGWLLWFDQARRDKAWSVVRSFEPAEQYKWAVTDTRCVDGRATSANVLEGRKPRTGAAGEHVQECSASLDPVFSEAMKVVRRLVNEAAPGGISAQPDTPDLWSRFFQLQAAYLLLWSIVERYTALRFGPGLDPWPRVKKLGEDTSFRKAVTDAGAKPGEVIDSRNPGSRYRLAADGAGAAEYFYQVRSNLSHRGKSAFKDAQLVYKAVTELSSAMKTLLERELPEHPSLESTASAVTTIELSSN